MANKRGVIVAAVALLVVLAGAGFGYGALSTRRAEPAASDAPSETPAETPAETPDDAPLLTDYDAVVYNELGESVRLSTIANGKPLVINFWATWCPYCVEEMPDFLELVREYGDAVSFAFVDATDGRRETKEAARSWLANNGFAELPAYYDLDSDAIATFGVGAFPTTVVVDGAGQIVAASPGAIDPELMRGLLNDLA